MASPAARALARVLWLSGRRRFFASAELDPERIVAERGDAARPTRAIRRRLDVTWAMREGCEVYTVAPRGRPSEATVLYLHGGAYIHPISVHHWRFIARMVERTGARFVVPFYPLAPGYDGGAAGCFVLGLYRELLERHGPSAMFVMGDSAGGGLALSLALQATAAGLPRGAGLVLLSPWLDVTASDPAQAGIERDDVMLMRPGIRTAGLWYAGALPPTDPRISPLFGRLAGLPPVLMFCGTHDILVTDARRLTERARREGVPLVYEEAPGLMHVYAILPLPEGRAAQVRIARFLEEPAA